jgi:RND family efflux transporter MFP subunit
MRHTWFFHKLNSVVSILYSPFVILFLLTSSCAPAEEKKETQTGRPVKVLQVKDPDSLRTRAFPAIARETRKVQMAFRVSGPLIDLPVDVGQYVHKGGLIAQIDPRDFTIRVKALEAKLGASRAQRVDAQLQYTRYENLHRKKAVPKAEYDHAKASYDMISAQVDANVQALEAARNALEDTSLRAPFDGYVDFKFVENYDNVLATQPIVTFLDCSVVEVTAGIPEEMVAEGIDFTSYVCSFDAYQGKRFPASLKEIGRKSQPSNQTYPLTVKLSSPESIRVRPGMAATVFVSFSLPDSHRPVVVPGEAVVNDKNGESYVWIYDPKTGVVHKKFVKVGKLISGGIEVISGLDPGMFVVTAGASLLVPGQKVSPIIPLETR